MADTGCHSCLAVLKVMKKLGLSVRDLILVDIEMHAANNNNIHILGATILRLSGKNNKGGEHSTRQIVYMTDNTDKLFLSREACADLGIIPNTFPTIGDAKDTRSTNSITSTDTPTQQQECQCPRQTKPPPILTLPFPATEANREKLQQYLLDYYGSSTFNTSKRQALPLMDSPPMRLIIDPNATPVTHHSPIPVPLHWQDAVNCGRHGITFNPEIFCFAQDEVEFAGFEITNNTVRPCKRYIRAIADFPIYTTEPNRCKIPVWLGEPGVIRIQHGRHDAHHHQQNP